MIDRLPIVAQRICELSAGELETAGQIAAELLHGRPELRLDPIFQELVPDAIEDQPCLHVDDLTEIQMADREKAFYQERARLRAGNGDLLATSLPEVAGYESYCRDQLGLGAVKWIQPSCEEDPLRLAEACWKDRETRGALVHQIRSQALRYVHPHMGSRACWELALLLRQASHRVVKVIAPPPAVTRFANDKAEFSALVQRLFGSEATPASAVAWNVATVAKRLQQLAGSATCMVAIKLPSSAGGEGNLLIAMREVRDRSLHEIDAMLHQRLPQLEYQCGDELLVTQWLDDIVAVPSAQLWIPPDGQLPVLEGIFAQLTDGGEGGFRGFHPHDFPSRLEQQIARHCLLLSRVYQLLGYVGRCSFDMLLVGADRESARLEFIECNGRWGGCSLPMTAMNRMFGDWKKQPFSSHVLTLDGVQRVPFGRLISTLGDGLYRVGESRGRCILFNPQRTLLRGEVSVLALHDDWQAARATPDNGVLKRFVERLQAAVAEIDLV